jgi:imidazolonepropionase
MRVTPINGLIKNAAMKRVINDFGKSPGKIKKTSLEKIDARGKVIMPGFVDSHTHLVFAGDRANEYTMRMEGKTYEQIAAAGGGIINTVSAVRKTPKAKLKSLAKERVWNSISFGVTTIEIKSIRT